MYEYKIFSLTLEAVHTSEPASFWWESVIAVIILLQVLETMS